LNPISTGVLSQKLSFILNSNPKEIPARSTKRNAVLILLAMSRPLKSFSKQAKLCKNPTPAVIFLNPNFAKIYNVSSSLSSGDLNRPKNWMYSLLMVLFNIETQR